MICISQTIGYDGGLSEFSNHFPSSSPSFFFSPTYARMGWTALHTAARDGDMKRLTRCVTGIKWLVSYP